LTIICSPSSDVSDRYNNLKAAWDSLIEAAEHANPRGFYIAVMEVLEQLKREGLKRKSAEPKKWSILSLLPPGILLPAGLLL
jgi:hypothetical protein